MLPMSVFLLTLAQRSGSAAQSSANTRALFWIGVLIVFTLAAGLVLMAMRRKLFQQQDAADETASLMDQLRAMRQRGELTEAEFNTARTAMRLRMSDALDKRNAAREPRLTREEQALIDRARGSADDGRSTRARSGPVSGGKSPDRATDSPSPPRVAPPGFDLTGAPLPKPEEPS
jgi:hypothetical protein